MNASCAVSPPSLHDACDARHALAPRGHGSMQNTKHDNVSTSQATSQIAPRFVSNPTATPLFAGSFTWYVNCQAEACEAQRTGLQLGAWPAALLGAQRPRAAWRREQPAGLHTLYQSLLRRHPRSMATHLPHHRELAGPLQPLGRLHPKPGSAVETVMQGPPQLLRLWPVTWRGVSQLKNQLCAPQRVLPESTQQLRHVR